MIFPKTNPNMRFIHIFSNWNQAKPAAEPKKGTQPQKSLKAPLLKMLAIDLILFLLTLQILLSCTSTHQLFCWFQRTTLSIQSKIQWAGYLHLNPRQGKKGPYFTQIFCPRRCEMGKTLAVLHNIHQPADQNPWEYLFSTYMYSIGTTAFLISTLRCYGKLWSRRCLTLESMQ